MPTACEWGMRPSRLVKTTRTRDPGLPRRTDGHGSAAATKGQPGKRGIADRQWAWAWHRASLRTLGAGADAAPRLAWGDAASTSIARPPT
jgi:hypothetical protein